MLSSIVCILGFAAAESYCEQKKPTDADALDTLGMKGTVDQNYGQVSLTSDGQEAAGAPQGYYMKDTCVWGSAVTGATGFSWKVVDESQDSAGKISTSSVVPEGMFCLVEMSRTYKSSNGVCASNNQALCFPKKMQSDMDSSYTIVGNYTAGSFAQNSQTNVVIEKIDADRKEEYHWFSVVNIDKSSFHGCESNAECTFTIWLYPATVVGPSDCAAGGSCIDDSYEPDSDAKVTDNVLPNLKAIDSNDYSDAQIKHLGAAKGSTVICDKVGLEVTLKTSASSAFDFKLSFDGISFDNGSAVTQEYKVTVPIKTLLI